MAIENAWADIMQQKVAHDKGSRIPKKLISVIIKEYERKRHNFKPATFYQNCFGNPRPDGIVINKNHQTPYILEQVSS